jgi:hypothetical protein
MSASSINNFMSWSKTMAITNLIVVIAKAADRPSQKAAKALTAK